LKGDEETHWTRVAKVHRDKQKDVKETTPILPPPPLWN